MKGAMLLSAVAAALTLASPAGAATYEVAGQQKAIDGDAATAKMTGGLRGRWTTTSFEEVALSPYYEAKGPSRSRAASTGAATAHARATRRGR